MAQSVIFLLCGVLLILYLCDAGEVVDEKGIVDMKHEIEDLQQKLSAIQKTFSQQNEKLLGTIDTLVENLEAKFSQRLQHFIQEIPDVSDIGKSLESTIMEMEKRFSNCSCDGNSLVEELASRLAENELETAKLRGQVEFLMNMWNDSDSCQISKPCVESVTSSATDVYPSMTSAATTEVYPSIATEVYPSMATEVYPSIPEVASSSLDTSSSHPIIPSYASVSDFSATSTTTEMISTSPSTSYTTATSVTTTPAPPVLDQLFVLMPLWSSYYLDFRTWDFRDEEKFFSISYNQMDAMTCSRNSGKVFVSTYSPDQIIRADFDGRNAVVVQMYVKSWGMTIDNTRDRVFLTTLYPSKAIFSMSSDGYDMRKIIDVSYSDRPPRGIAVNPRTQVIYASVDERLFSVNYDGSGKQYLVKGYPIYGVAVDVDTNHVYYNIGRRIFRMNVPDQSVTEIIELEVIAYQLEYYENKLYFSGYGDPTVGVIDLESRSVLTQRRIFQKNVENFAICPY